MGGVDAETLPGYKLMLTHPRPAWRQLPFAELFSGWPASVDPILAVQYEALIWEIVNLDSRAGIIFTARGRVQRDNGGGIIVISEDEKSLITLLANSF